MLWPPVGSKVLVESVRAVAFDGHCRHRFAVLALLKEYGEFAAASQRCFPAH